MDEILRQLEALFVELKKITYDMLIPLDTDAEKEAAAEELYKHDYAFRQWVDSLHRSMSISVSNMRWMDLAVWYAKLLIIREHQARNKEE